MQKDRDISSRRLKSLLCQVNKLQGKEHRNNKLILSKLHLNLKLFLSQILVLEKVKSLLFQLLNEVWVWINQFINRSHKIHQQKF